MRTEDAIVTVKRRFEEDSKKSIRQRVQQLALYPLSLWGDVGVGLRAYKIQHSQESKTNDHKAHRLSANGPDFHKK